MELETIIRQIQDARRERPEDKPAMSNEISIVAGAKRPSLDEPPAVIKKDPLR